MQSFMYRRGWLFFYLALLSIAGSVFLPFSVVRGYAAGKADAQADWPMYGYDPGHSNFNANEHLLSPDNVGSLTLKWKVSTNGQTQNDSPAVIDGSVYFGAGALYALNASNGAMRWWRVVPSTGTPTIYKDLVFANMVNGGCLSAFIKQTGELKWSLCGSASSPVVVGDTLYLANQAQILAVDASTGIIKWSFYGGGGTPAYADGVLYVSVGFGIYALDAATGKLLWGNSTRGGIMSPPVVEQGVVYVCASDNKVYAINAKTGIIRWVYDLQQVVSTAPAVANGLVYTVAGRTLYAIDTSRGELKWRYNAANYIQSSPALANGVVYFTALDGQLYAIDALIGNYLMSRTIAPNGNVGVATDTSPVVANGAVYVPSGGNLYAFALPGQ